MAGYHWSVHQVTEYFSAISGEDDVAMAVQVAVERAAEAFDAECVALLADGAVVGLVGLPQGTTLPGVLVEAVGSSALLVPGLGACHVVTTRPSRVGGEQLVAVRREDAFTAEECQLLQGMAQVLAVALRTLRTLGTERTLRADREREAEERLRLLGVVQARERLLEQLLSLQQAITRRQPLPEVLTAVALGASGLLAGAAVAVTLRPSTGAPASTIAAASAELTADQRDLVLAAVGPLLDGTSASEAPAEVRVLAVPVQVGAAVEGSLVALVPWVADAVPDLDLLAAFAQQVSSALTDARAVQEVQEARHDQLTGLPTRTLFLRRLDEALGARDRHPLLTLLFIDLDRFKQVNDSLGHAAGDELLRAVAQRLRGCLRQTDTPARLGGDEFAVLLDGLDPAACLRVAQRITSVIGQPFTVAGREVVIASSIGMVQPSADQVDGPALLSSADVAMYRSKKAGNGVPVLFEPAMHLDALRALDLQSDLRQALSRGELSVAYQPLVALGDRRPVGVEALMRWTHPQRGPVPPSVFIPLAEEMGLVVELGRWVLRESTRQLARWRTEFPSLTVNVNVSGRQLVDPDFADDVLDALACAGLPPAALTLELTESELMADPVEAARRFARLRDLGVRLAIDDFGTGYSSLAHLRRLPVDELKIDQSFVAGLGSSAKDRAVVRTIVELGRDLAVTTVAEGIEDAVQLDILTELGCDVGQGYHLSRPGPPDAVPGELRRAGLAAEQPRDREPGVLPVPRTPVRAARRACGR